MHGVKKLEDAESPSMEYRAIIINTLLKTLNQPSMEMDMELARFAKRRLAELKSGWIKTVPGNEVFSKIRERFEK